MDEGEAGQAEGVLRQALASARTAPFPLLAWQLAEAESALGACLVALHRYSEGQILLRNSEPGLRTHPDATLRRMALRRSAKQPPLKPNGLRFDSEGLQVVRIWSQGSRRLGAERNQIAS